MRLSYFLVLIFISTLFTSCRDTDYEILEMRVSDHKEIGYNIIGPESLYLVQVEEEIGGAEWDRTFGIEDFDYKWGYVYNILVEKKYYDEPRLDASSFRYVFIKEISREKVEVGSQFELILQRTYEDGNVEIFWEEEQDGFSIAGNKSFICADLCSELRKKGEAFTLLLGIFEHFGDGEIKLVDLKTQNYR
ncbi:DUF4377 domain-containing protein [Rhodohalobacter sulfatireducens]|uniref:DUF4377 domain-containing protein n=1 Tax=Rhodohalobacter sulfatireducens TaxID=2911366 RepID=A0ABS9KIE9_9BACT|nr:DUF4377 domain-containing protein [Rhodohalobacter sulfatireducens]MCG2590628.1 DUF4377 domain-containing protein [Rhodohalobacter sulfatireducens]